jgi:phosphohistidine swiveling domain-containing protein
VKNLVKDSTKAGVWTFSTDAVELFASNTKSVKNNIKITIKGSDGKVYDALATVTLDTKRK